MTKLDLPAARERALKSLSERPARRLGVAGAAALLATLAVLIGAGSASAIILHAHGATFGVQPVPAAASGALRPFASASKGIPRNGVRYRGGPVMSSNTNYAFYWDPSGAPKYPSGYQTGLNRFFEDLAHDSGRLSNSDSVLEQYTGDDGEFADYESHFAGALIDADPYPANGCSAAPICLTDEQLQAELTSYVQSHKLPMDLQHEYFLLTPPHVESCFEADGFVCSAETKAPAYCAYHGFIPLSAGHVIVYANDPYVGETVCDTHNYPNENVSDATLAGGLVHEHSESVTDPELDSWYSNDGEEVADLCRTFEEGTEYGEPLGKAPDGAFYNELVNGHFYWYQQEWSNEADACVQRAPQAPTVSKLKPKSGSKSGGTVVTVTGKGFLGEVSVAFGGVPASGVVVNSTTSLSVIAPPSSASGVVDLTVKTVGTSTTTKKDRFRYKK